MEKYCRKNFVKQNFNFSWISNHFQLHFVRLRLTALMNLQRPLLLRKLQIISTIHLLPKKNSKLPTQKFDDNLGWSSSELFLMSQPQLLKWLKFVTGNRLITYCENWNWISRLSSLIKLASIKLALLTQPSWMSAARGAAGFSLGQSLFPLFNQFHVKCRNGRRKYLKHKHMMQKMWNYKMLRASYDVHVNMTHISRADSFCFFSRNWAELSRFYFAERYSIFAMVRET